MSYAEVIVCGLALSSFAAYQLVVTLDLILVLMYEATRHGHGVHVLDRLLMIVVVLMAVCWFGFCATMIVLSWLVIAVPTALIDMSATRIVAATCLGVVLCVYRTIRVDICYRPVS